jgi:AraC-like DNA-binding protein
MQTVNPSPKLAGIVRSFTIVETADAMTSTLIPETGAVLGIRYRGSAAMVRGSSAEILPDWAFTGIRDSVRRIRTSANGGLIAVNFHETGASEVFTAPMPELFNAIVNLQEWLPGHRLEQARQNLATAPDTPSRIDLIEDFLLRGKVARQPDRMVEVAVRAMRARRGSVSIRLLAQQIGVSQERFEKRFRREVGTSPKQYCSILRLRFALKTYRPARTLTDLALEAGYYDQSHFIREFRAVTGETPLRFLRRGDYC